MRLKSIYASPEEKQIYITNQLLNRGYGANSAAVSQDVVMETGTPQTILVANPNRKSLTISNPSASTLYVNFGVTAVIGTGFFILPTSSQTITPVSTAYVSAIIADDHTITILEL